MTVTVGDRDQRPWGSFEVVAQGAGYQVKRICVLPGQQLSLQRHQRRQEHWVVVQGIAAVQLGDRWTQLHVGQAIDIAIGEWHRLKNAGSEVLELVEVQIGSYLGEDDIERIADDYGRLTIE